MLLQLGHLKDIMQADAEADAEANGRVEVKLVVKAEVKEGDGGGEVRAEEEGESRGESRGEGEARASEREMAGAGARGGGYNFATSALSLAAIDMCVTPSEGATPHSGGVGAAASVPVRAKTHGRSASTHCASSGW